MNTRDIEARDYSFAQAFYSEPYACHRFVIGTPSRPEAKRRAECFATDRWGQPRKVIVYPRNYVKDARALFAQGLHD